MLPDGPPQQGSPPAVLRIRAFRRLWVALSLSSLGDWLGILATTSLAQELVSGYSGKLYALSGVLVIRLLPSLLIGPLAGAFADRFDRRRTMVVADVVRFGLYVSIALVHSLPWLLGASFVIECASLFWIPAKEASVPNLVPRERLESANQLSLVTTYGSAAVASLVFAVLARIGAVFGDLAGAQVDLALYFDAGTFLFSAATIFGLREIAGVRRDGHEEPPSLTTSILDGWRFIGTSRWLRGLLIGILGAVAAGGAVIGLGRPFAVLDLHGGNAAYGMLFGTVFLGLASGMFLGPRLLTGLSRRRMMPMAIVAAGLSLAINALMPNLALAILMTFLVGAFAGISWVVGITLVGLHVSDELRGRTFASLYTLMRIDLLLVIAAAPFLAATIGPHQISVTDDLQIRADGVTAVLFGSGVLALVVGLLCFRMMDDRPGIGVWTDVVAAVRGDLATPQPPQSAGFFIVIEGGEGAGKSTQLRMLAEWLGERGHSDVVVTAEPGGTPAGRRLRELLLDPATGALAPQTEALLYAADRAQHVAEVVRPALDRGAVVVSDRYVDSSLAYQGAGRTLPADDVDRLSRWATGALVPDLTILLDVDPVVGLRRVGDHPDRIEAESVEFHRRVREGFLTLSRREPERYLVVDASRPPAEVHAHIRTRVVEVLAPEAAASPVGSVS